MKPVNPNSRVVNRSFEQRHIGPGLGEQRSMLSSISCASMEDLISKTVPGMDYYF